MIGDLINGAFELLGGFFILLSVFKIHKSKRAEGIHWGHMAFFTTWGFWNLFYYPSLDQWASFAGGAWLVAVNTFFLGQVIYYSRFYKPQHYIVEYDPERDGKSWSDLDWLHGSWKEAASRAERHAGMFGRLPLTWVEGLADRHGKTWVAETDICNYRIRQ